MEGLRLHKDNKVTVIRCCTYCRKTFSLRSKLIKHEEICSHKNKSKYKLKKEKIQEENNLLISYSELANEVNILKKTVNQQQNIINELMKYIKNERKQINILEYLNDKEQVEPLDKDFISIIKDYEISREVLIKFLELKYIEGIYYIFKEIFNIDNEKNHSIRCFYNKQNTFFINTKLKDNSYKWIEMKKTHIEKCLNILNKKLWDALLEYREENIDLINKSDKEFQKFNDYNQIINGLNICEREKIRKIKGLLYNYLKRELKTIVKYEFSF